MTDEMLNLHTQNDHVKSRFTAQVSSVRCRQRLQVVPSCKHNEGYASQQPLPRLSQSEEARQGKQRPSQQPSED